MVNKILDRMSKIIIQSIPFFILLGFLSLFNERNYFLFQLKETLRNYIIPVIICYNSGKEFHEKYGGIVSVIIISSFLINGSLQSFIEPIIIGFSFGYFTKKYFQLTEKIKLPGFEMLINNLSLGLLSLVFSYFVYKGIPYYKLFQDSIQLGLKDLVFNNRFIPFLSILIEPGKIFFMNNFINHGLLTPLGYSEVKEAGKSIFFLLETNPGPGLGILIYYYIVNKKEKNINKIKEVRTNFYIHFIGGIHEVYFPYVLKNIKLIFALIAGAFVGNFIFLNFNLGLVGLASPGSIILLMLLAPLESKLLVLFGVISSSIVTFGLAYIFDNKKDGENIMEEKQQEDLYFSPKEKLRICVACDAGMGSSAMGATLFRKKLEKEKIKNIEVFNSSIDNVPENVNVIVVHSQLFERLKVDKEGKNIYIIEDFMDGAFYDNLVKKIKEKFEEKEAVEEISLSSENKELKILEKENIKVGLKRVEKNLALKEATDLLIERGYVEKEYFESMLEREKISSTYLDYGIAIPHCTKEGRKFIRNCGVAVLQYPYGIDYGNRKKVYLLIAIASLEDRHMEILNKLAEIFDDEKTAEELSTTSTIDSIYNCLLSLEDKNA